MLSTVVGQSQASLGCMAASNDSMGHAVELGSCVEQLGWAPSYQDAWLRHQDPWKGSSATAVRQEHPAVVSYITDGQAA